MILIPFFLNQSAIESEEMSQQGPAGRGRKNNEEIAVDSGSEDDTDSISTTRSTVSAVLTGTSSISSSVGETSRQLRVDEQFQEIASFASMLYTFSVYSKMSNCFLFFVF